VGGGGWGGGGGGGFFGMFGGGVCGSGVFGVGGGWGCFGGGGGVVSFILSPSRGERKGQGIPLLSLKLKMSKGVLGLTLATKEESNVYTCFLRKEKGRKVLNRRTRRGVTFPTFAGRGEDREQRDSSTEGNTLLSVHSKKKEIEWQVDRSFTR